MKVVFPSGDTLRLRIDPGAGALSELQRLLKNACDCSGGFSVNAALGLLKGADAAAETSSLRFRYRRSEQEWIELTSDNAESFFMQESSSALRIYVDISASCDESKEDSAGPQAKRPKSGEDADRLEVLESRSLDSTTEVLVKLVKPDQAILRLRLNGKQLTIASTRLAVDAVLTKEEADVLSIWFVDCNGVLRELSSSGDDPTAEADFNALLQPEKQSRIIRLIAIAADTASKTAENTYLPLKSTSMQEQEEALLRTAIKDSQEVQRAKEITAAEARSRLQRVLDLYRVRLRPVEGDGNCQFRALAVQLHGDEAQLGSLRKQICQQLRGQRERYEQFVDPGVTNEGLQGCFDDYIVRMELDGTWGDNVTLQAASDLFGREIHVLTDQAGSEYVKLRPCVASCVEEQGTDGASAEAAGRRPLCLTFIAEVHYDAAEP